MDATTTPAAPRRGATRPTARARLRTVRVLSGMVLVLMVVASAGGLFAGNLYQDPAAVVAVLRAYDLVTLVVAAPALAVVLLPRFGTSRRAQLVWLGVLGYAVYNYAIYMFGSVFNDFFLVHVALFALSVYALVLALGNLDVEAVARGFRERTPVRTVSVLLALLAVGLGGMWVFYSLRYAITGAFPGESLLVLPAAMVHLGYVLDLVLVVPGCAVAAVLLWRRTAWGYPLATLMLVFGTVYQLNYLAALVFQARAGVPGATGWDPAEPFILGVFAVGAALMLGSVRPGPRGNPPGQVREG